ncbi:hypothetical protein K458DRAFT_413016 [Lentithecium fluviatile CBS 122367]|uniref:Uncharacterized protein n=1 Tax=Lentithecium fluviatile CBS 122367 TaxID=1168545 RepID=A0A6G1JJ64_9PLEO|nr:hypothetical protein K458DRAFT_413016 [Lentithecium fluviatile CBS 122367]
MMLDMLTADHHHSPPRRAPSPANGSFLQMPFSILGNVLRKQNAPACPAVAKVEPEAPVPDGTNKSTNLMKTEPEAPASPTSRPASAGSSAASEGEKRKKKAARPKTTYKLAQPPPSSHQKLHLRPKVLLQLHQVVASSRPRPVYEVIPYSILAPVSTRRLARTFRKDKLGAQDLLIVKAEEYGNNEDAKSDDERWGSREVVGIICPGKEEKGSVARTEVLMDNGSSWEVKPAPNGGYEFSYTDDHGLMLKARWITRPSVTRSQSITSTSPTAAPDTRKFKFSTINPNSRRHPVIATMTRDRIEVFDTYMMPTATSPATPSQPSSAAPTPAATPSAIDMDSFMDKDNLPVTTDDALRRFIVTSGIWVAFCENWSPAYSSSKAACCTPLSTPTTARPLQPNRSISMTFVDPPRSASPSSTNDENKRTIPRLIRTGTQLLHRNASFDTSPEISSPTSSSPSIRTRRGRSNSTGNAELQSSTGSTKKRFGLGLEGQPLTETEEERQSKRSSELLRIKELSLPASPASPNQTLSPIPSAEPAASERSISPAFSNPRTKKARSAYNPVTTAGMWDSGVSEGRSLKTRPTSMVVVQEKKKKARRKEARSRSKEREKDKGNEKKKTSRRTSEGFRQLFSGIFRREKVA